MRWKTFGIWAFIVAVVIAVAIDLLIRSHRLNTTLLTFQGAVVRKDPDLRRELPIAGVVVRVTRGEASISTQTDGSGYFKLTFPEVIWPGQNVVLTFSRDGYESMEQNLHIQFRSAAKRLVIAEMTPEATSPDISPETGKPAIAVTNIRVRYTENYQTEENIGSAVRTFEVKNQGNVPCRRQAPCSPDGLWKATMGTEALDAGADNVFRNMRASCIAGPCPFTRIDSSGFVHGGRNITVSATNWSDTATFLFEAEVFRTTISSSVRHSYPVIFGRTLNFTLPPTQEGVSIEADLNGAPMVFPLGPDLYLSWASCNARTNSESERSTVYRCELKPGYRF